MSEIPYLRLRSHQELWSRFWFLVFGFWFLVCYATTQLATPLQQRRMQVVRSNKVARKRLTESNGTPAIDLRQMNVGLK